MTHDDMIAQLNHLVQVNKYAEGAFRTAAENVKNSELETLFGGYAKQHAKFVAELRKEISRRDGEVDESGSWEGTIHRRWMDVKSALSDHSAAVVLASCESHEESAEIAYDDAADAISSGQTHTLIEKHRQHIKGCRTHLARLVGETKDGIDFQTNE